MNLQKNFLYMFEKITLFSISICIMKLIDQKTQNNFCSTQIIVDGFALNDKVEIQCRLEGWCSTNLGIACQPACNDLPSLVENGTWSCQDGESAAPYVECVLTCQNGTRMIGDGIVWCGLGQTWTGQDEICTG